MKLWSWSHIICKDVWLLHAQPYYYAQQDVPLNSPDIHLVRKGICLLHAQPFYAQQDAPLKTTDIDIVIKDI